ncbi:tetratricopeptide repeat protein [Frankia sp. Cj3]|uniref:tetratricopeptide repeat protein n=1 Tax=Frankia sp. Cj3 TaxID=2880976 RepID=UPI001EF3E764|nr:tetratricopeptide repeat protein [Frankia sp. Cj3]
MAGRLADGESIVEVRRSLLPPEWAELLRFCAAAHAFSEDILRTVLLPAAGLKPVPVLGILEKQGLVEPASGRPDRYQLCPEDRAYFMARWFEELPEGGIPAGLATLSEQLAEYHRKANDELERLRHEMFARPDDPDHARNLFEKAIDSAVRKRDFSSFQDLLDALGDRNRVGRAGLVDFHAEQVGRFRVLQFWAGDHERSVRFLEPAGMPDQVEALLVRGDTRAWQMFGPSGVGKTTRLRWLITRRCIPSRIPCARVDLDVVDPVALGRYPWLVLLRIAEQLRLHWPVPEFDGIRYPVFEAMLSAHGVFASLLRGKPSEYASGAGRTLSDGVVADRVGRDVTATFAHQLNEVAGDRPTLIVVDTIEEMSRYGEEGLEKLLDLLADVHSRCPSLRLVLAGRENLRDAGLGHGRDRLAALLDRLGCFDVRAGPFGVDESRTYLRGIRGIENAEQVNAVVSIAEGVPLTLALYADFINLNPHIGTDELQAGLLPPLRHLIDRVSDPGVVFLLRYGIVPHKLRREYVAAVMRRFLARAVAGLPLADTPDAEGRHPPEPSLDDAGVERIWQDLLFYTAASSWVQYEPGDPETITFHPNAITSMYRLVATDPVFSDLHRAFAAHFTVQAENPESGSVADRCQAFYHRFQVGDPQAPMAWREALDSSRREGKLDDLAELAREVLGDEYLDGNGRPKRVANGRWLIEPEVVAEAWLFVAYAVFRRSWRERAGGADPRWAAVIRCLGRYDAFGADLHPSPLPRAGLATTLRTALKLALADTANGRKAASDAVSSLRGAGVNATEDDQIDLLALLGDCHAVLGKDEAESYYRAALDAIERQHWRGRADEIWSARIRYQVARGDFNKALDYCNEAIRDRTVRQGHSPIESSLALENRRIDIFNRRGEPSSARWMIGSPVQPRMDAAALAVVARARAQADILLGDDERAGASLDEAEEHARRVPGEEGLRHLAETFQLRGSLWGELLRLGAATSEFRRADLLWRNELGYVEGHPAWRAAFGSFLLRQVGDVAEARRILPDPEVLTPSIDGPPGAFDEVAVRSWLLSVEAYTTDDDIVGERLEMLREHLDRMAERRSPPQVAALVAVTGLMLASSRRTYDRRVVDGFVTRLTSCLRAIQPPNARLVPLSDLVDCRVPLVMSPAVGSLLECLREAAPGPVGPHTNRTYTYPLWSRAVRLCGGEVPPDVPAPLADGRIGLLAWWRWVRYSSALDAHGAGPVVGDAEFEDAVLAPLLEHHRPPLLRGWARRLRADVDGVPHRDRARMLADAVAIAMKEPGESRWLADIQFRLAEVTRDPTDLYAADNRYASLSLPYRTGRDVYKQLLADGPGEAVLEIGYPDAELPRNIDSLQGVIVAARLGVSGMPDTSDEPAPEIFGVLGRELAHRIHSVVSGGDPCTLGLSSDDPIVQMLPWELADSADTFDHRWRFGLYRRMPLAAFPVDTRWLRAAREMLDGDRPEHAAVDPEERMRLHEVLRHHRSAGDEQWVAVVRPASRIADETALSLRLPGFDVARGYTEYGFRARDVSQLDMLNAGLRLDPPPAVLHLSARLGISAITPYLDLAGTQEIRRPGTRTDDLRIRPRDVAAWIRGLKSGQEPVVVLDPPHPAMSTDLPRQLLFRNLFAALLFQQAVVPIVVATGLGDDNSRNLVAKLAEGLRAGRSLMSVLGDIRQVAWRESTESSDSAALADDTFASRATAVFAASSELEIQ